MYQILTLNKISKTGLAHFDPQKFACADDLTNPDAIIVRSASLHDMELPENLLAVATDLGPDRLRQGLPENVQVLDLNDAEGIAEVILACCKSLSQPLEPLPQIIFCAITPAIEILISAMIFLYGQKSFSTSLA